MLIMSFIIIFTLSIEFFLRYIFPVYAETHILYFDNSTKILKGKLNLQGRVMTFGALGKFRFNNEGWNSPRDYYSNKTARYRIACIGSSETESFQTDINNSYPVILEKELLAVGIDNEVYSFAKTRTSLAQALHIARHVIDRFHPDVVMVTPVNDLLIDLPKPSNFMAIKISNDNRISEVLPAEYRPNLNDKNFKVLRSVFSHSKTILIFYKIIHPFIKQILVQAKSNQSPLNKKSIYIPDHEKQLRYLKRRYPAFQKKYDLARSYLFGKLNELGQSNNVKIIFILGPQLGFGTDHQKRSDDELLTVKNSLERYALPYCDLTEPFLTDHSLSGRSFTSFLDPYHFNTYGHKIAGKAIANYLLSNNYIV
jgi:hypothetical protein